jgi:hypothetical protein
LTTTEKIGTLDNIWEMRVFGEYEKLCERNTLFINIR